MLFKQAIFVALLWPLAWATSCRGPYSCPDETSLVQLQRIVTPGGERPAAPPAGDNAELLAPKEEGTKEEWPTPVHDWYAESDSMPGHLDKGEVIDAFDANLAKVKDHMMAKASEKIEFENMVHEERKANRRAAEVKVKKDGHDIEKAWEADRAEVHKVEANREASLKEQENRVASAKEDAEAHEYKKEQAEQAALAGRMAGQYEAQDEEQSARQDMYDSWKQSYLKERRHERRKYLKKEHDREEAAVDVETHNIAKDEQDWAKAADQNKKEQEASDAATAAEEKEMIAGPEGLDNHIIETMADVEVKDYSRNSFKDQDRISNAATGKWPHAHWPYNGENEPQTL